MQPTGLRSLPSPSAKLVPTMSSPRKHSVPFFVLNFILCNYFTIKIKQKYPPWALPFLQLTSFLCCSAPELFPFISLILFVLGFFFFCPQQAQKSPSTSLSPSHWSLQILFWCQRQNSIFFSWQDHSKEYLYPASSPRAPQLWWLQKKL